MSIDDTSEFELRRIVTSLKLKRCGNCDHWMKSSECPREIEGRKRGPSMNDFPCKSFTLSDDYKPYEKRLFWKKMQNE